MGNALAQMITAKDSLSVTLSIKDIANVYGDEVLKLRGLTTKSTVTTATKDGEFVEKQEINVALRVDYDDWGNAKKQHINSLMENGTTVLSQKDIVNEYGDVVLKLRGLTTKSTVTTTAAGGEFVEKQTIDTASYDAWGNAETQTITAKTALDVTLSIKDIVNVYGDEVLKLRGLTTSSTVTTNTKDNVFVEKQTIDTAGYDAWGNAENQTITAKDSLNVTLSIKDIANVYGDEVLKLRGLTTNRQ